ncbi:MAG: hypothetical protein ABI091_04470 [Ferruginibacter sp.]
MEKKFCILIEDDWEVLGNGLGNVAQLQYLPSLYFMKLAKRLGINLTFMVEVVQQLEFIKHLDQDYNIRVQKNLWDDNIRLMIDYGFDVQLHLHPQWLNAEYKDDYFFLRDNWNMGKYEPAEQEKMITESIAYLENLIRPMKSDYKVVAYKGGSWGLQPSDSLFKTLDKAGVRVVMGVREGMSMPKNGVNYEGLEEKVMPYSPDYADIKKVSATKNNITIIPLQPFEPGLVPLTSIAASIAKRKINKQDAMRHYYDNRIPEAISNLSPFAGESKLRFAAKPYTTHLKIGNQPFTYLKSSIDSVINNLKNSEYKRIPIVIECHTKQYPQYYSDIEKFLSYILEKYNDVVEFKTLSAFSKEIDENPSIVKVKNAGTN